MTFHVLLACYIMISVLFLQPLGVPVSEQPDQHERYRKKSIIPSQLDLTELEDYILQLFPNLPQLSRVGFTFAKATKMRQLVPVHGTTVSELRQEVNRSQLFIHPKRDLLAVVSIHLCYYIIYI